MNHYNLKIGQPEDGYRYSIDAILLAEFVRIKPGAKILELGAGCGIISLIVARRFSDCSIDAVEIQDVLFHFLQKNIKENLLESRITPVHQDIKRIKTLYTAGSFDHVITNPPFRHPVSGRLCLNAQEALARHEILIDLQGILKATFRALRPGGKFSIIYPAERLSYLLTQMTRARLEPKRLRCIHPSYSRQARMVMIQGVKEGGVEIRIETPLFLKDGSGISKI